MSNYNDGSGYRGPGGGLPKNQQDPYSTASLIVGILAIILGLFCGLLAIPVGIGAIILGIKGRTRLQEMGRPTGIATAGIAMGITSIVVTLAFLAAVTIFDIGVT